jgi:hypothetical protein
MALKTTNVLKVLIRIAAVAGVVITLFNLTGLFLDKDRQAIYDQLLEKSTKYRVSILNPAVKDFLAEFYFSKPICPEMRPLEIKGLMLKWIAMGNNPPMSGTVHVEFTNGKHSTSVCRLDELKQWSAETPFYAWLGWWLMAVSVTFEIVIDVFEYREKRKKVPTNQSAERSSTRLHT